MLGFLRPFRGGVVASLLLSCTAIVGTVAIPLLIGETVDAIRTHERSHILPLALAIVGAGLLRIAFSIPSDRDLPRLTAHGAVFDILLTRSATLIDVELDQLTAIGTTRLDLDHVVCNGGRSTERGRLFGGALLRLLRLFPAAVIALGHDSLLELRSIAGTNGTVG